MKHAHQTMPALPGAKTRTRRVGTSGAGGRLRAGMAFRAAARGLAFASGAAGLLGAAGSALAQVAYTVTEAVTVTNGGHVLADNDSLTVAATGSIAADRYAIHVGGDSQNIRVEVEAGGSVSVSTVVHASGCAIQNSGGGSNTFVVHGRASAEGYFSHAICNRGSDGSYVISADASASAAGQYGSAIHNNGDRNTYRVSGTISSASNRGSAIWNGGGNYNTYTVSGNASVTGVNSHAIENSDGSNNTYTVSGSVDVGGMGSDAIVNQRGSNNIYTVSGRVSVVDADRYAIHNIAGSGNRYTIKSGAEVTGIVYTEVPATLVIEDGADISAAAFPGAWLGAGGRPLPPQGRTYRVDGVATEVNGGYTLAGNDVLIVSSAGSIAGAGNAIVIGGADETAADRSHNVRVEVEAGGSVSAAGDNGQAIANHGRHGTYVIDGRVSATGDEGSAIYNSHWDSRNAYVINGSVTATGDNGRAIYNSGGYNSYEISGRVSAAGEGGYAIYNRSGYDSTYTIKAGAVVTGIAYSGTPTSSGKVKKAATLIIEDGADVNGAAFQGYWVTVDGDPFPFPGRSHTVGRASTETNGGHALGNGDSLTVTSAGSIGTEGVAISSSGNDVTVNVNAGGSVSATGRDSRAIHNDGGDRNTYRISGSVSAAGYGVNAIQNGDIPHRNSDGSDHNTFIIDGSVSVTGESGAAIDNHGDGNTFEISGRVSATGAYGSAIRDTGSYEYGNSYVISGRVSATGENGHAIYSLSGVTYTIKAGAVVTGIVHAQRSGIGFPMATLVIEDGADVSGAIFQGDWQTVDGNLFPFTGRTHTIAAATTEENGGFVLGNNDTLVVASTASVRNLRIYGIDDLALDIEAGGKVGKVASWYGDRNTYVIDGSVSASGDYDHAIHDKSGNGNRYEISGSVSAAGEGGYAIRDEDGSGNRYVIKSGAVITGIVFSDTYREDASVLVIEAGADVSGAVFQGNWRIADGGPYPFPGETYAVGEASTETNGGHPLGNGDSLTVTPAGSISVSSGSAVQVTGSGVTVNVAGSVSATGVEGHAVYTGDDGSGNTYQIGGSVSAAGEGGNAIDENGSRNTYVISGSVSATGQSGHAIAVGSHGYSSGSTYEISGNVIATGANGHAVYNRYGRDNTYVISGTVTATGENGHAIYNRFGHSNTYEISGRVSATGENGHAIYNYNASRRIGSFGGSGTSDNTYVIKSGAVVTGIVRTDVVATLIIEDGADVSGAIFEGVWQDARGAVLPVPGAYITATEDGGGELRVPYVEVRLGSSFEYQTCLDMTMDMVSQAPLLAWEVTSAPTQPEGGCTRADGDYGTPRLSGEDRTLEVPTVLYHPGDGDPVCFSLDMRWAGGYRFTVTGAAGVSCP